MTRIKKIVHAVLSVASRGAVLMTALLFFLAGPALAADAEVKIDNFTFNPPRLIVKAGTTVTWDNDDDIPHTVVATGKAFRSKTLDTEDKFSFTFTTPGTYEYFCSLHPHMTGSIVVEAATGATQ
jgi:amicyanin